MEGGRAKKASRAVAGRRGKLQDLPEIAFGALNAYSSIFGKHYFDIFSHFMRVPRRHTCGISEQCGFGEICFSQPFSLFEKSLHSDANIESAFKWGSPQLTSLMFLNRGLGTILLIFLIEQFTKKTWQRNSQIKTQTLI
jgi:hypothetical protein